MNRQEQASTNGFGVGISLGLRMGDNRKGRGGYFVFFFGIVRGWEESGGIL